MTHKILKPFRVYDDETEEYVIYTPSDVFDCTDTLLKSHVSSLISTGMIREKATTSEFEEGDKETSEDLGKIEGVEGNGEGDNLSESSETIGKISDTPSKAKPIGRPASPKPVTRATSKK